jgi:hypothetical protein
VLPTGASAGAEVGGKLTAAAVTGAAADEAGKWGHDGTPSGTLEEHCRTELPQHSTSLLPCGRRSHHLL